MTWLDAYQGFMTGIETASGLDDSVLHTHGGILILLVARLVTRFRLSTMVPLAILTILELSNETMDCMSLGRCPWPDTSSDLFHTLLWPTLLSFGALLRDRLPLSR